MIHDLLMHIGSKTGCHQRSDRSFFWNGKQFPVCACCTGIMCGYVASIPLFLIIRQSFLFYAALCLPLIVDGLTQYWGWQTSTNRRRFLTGVLAGYGVLSMMLHIVLILF